MRFPEHRYRNSDQPRTLEERTVELIVGEPQVIIDRGEQINELGELMQRAATTLQKLADGELGAGMSIDKIRSVAGDLHADLHVAGELYAPSGQALRIYGQALDRVQSSTDSLVPNSETKWADVVTAAYALQSANSQQSRYDDRAAQPGADVESLGDRPSVAAEQGAFDQVVGEWESYWLAYDAPVASWELSYRTAVRRLERANSSGPEDGFWDNAMPFIEGLLTVLTWVGIVAFVLALVLSGPLALVLGAIALVAGIIVVALEASKFLAGRGDMMSLGLSIAGIIPFGKLATLGKVLKNVPSGKFGTGVRHLGSELGDGFRALREVNGPLLRGGNAKVNPMIMPRFYAIDSAYHFLFKNPPGLNSMPRIMENLTGIPGGKPTNLTEALAGTGEAFSNLFGLLDGGLSLAGQGRHEPGAG